MNKIEELKLIIEQQEERIDNFNQILLKIIDVQVDRAQTSYQLNKIMKEFIFIAERYIHVSTVDYIASLKADECAKLYAYIDRLREINRVVTPPNCGKPESEKVKANGWISVEDNDNRPEDGEEVWVYDWRGRVHIARAINEKGYTLAFEGTRATRWMKLTKPLPPLPEEE